MKFNQMKVLAKDEIQAIHQATIELLENVGIRIESNEAKEKFKEYGAYLDESGKSDYVKIPEELMKEQLKKVPDNFDLYGPDGSFKLTVNTVNINFATFGATVNIFDTNKKKLIRKTSLEDTIKHIRIVNELENISCSHMDVWPHDIPFTELHCHTLREWAKHSYKPYGMACYGRTASQDIINLLSIIVGGEEELIKRPRFLTVFNPTSPLRLTQILLNGLFVFAKYKQPILISAAASAGSTAPVTLAGCLTQANAEVISSILLTQLINPGTPVLYGSTNTIMDPLTGNVAYGSVEFALITVAAAQLAHFYNIPSKGSGALTDSKCFDIQNGFERFMTLLFAANAGHNYITCAGTYESILSEALELLVIDDEFAGIIKRGMEGINVNQETLAYKEIKRIAEENKNYLSLKHTAKNVRKEIYVPKLIDRKRRGIWIKEGAKDIMDVAKERIERIMKTQSGPGLTSEVKEKLNNYTLRVALRTLDDYKKLEGVNDSKNSIDITGLSINK